MKVTTLCTIGFTLLAAASLAAVDTTAHAVGDSIEVVTVITAGSGYTGQTLVIHGSVIGPFVSGESSGFTIGPFAIGASNEPQTVVVRVQPPYLERFYGVYAMLRDGDGAETRPDRSFCVPAVTYVACREAVATRGWLHRVNESCLSIEVCDPDFENWQQCLPSGCAIEARPEWAPYVDSGRLVDVYATEMYGPNTPCTEPGTHCVTATRVEQLSDGAGCGALSSETLPWGGIKAMFH